MDWNRVNVWTNTLYAIVHSICIAKKDKFGDLDLVDKNLRDASSWVPHDCSYASVLLNHQSKGSKITFRRDPNKHLTEIANQLIKMLMQDLVVIMDEMMEDVLNNRGESAGSMPQSKIQKLSKNLDPKYLWASHGCLELVAARNVLTHSGGKWNERSLAIIKPFVSPLPNIGEKLDIGFTMLFRYRKAMRTFLNETKVP